MNVLQVFRAPVGGLFRHVCDLSRELRRAGHSVAVVFALGDPTEICNSSFDPAIFNLGIWRVPMGRYPESSDWRTLASLHEIVSSCGIDVIHGHGAKGGTLARLLRIRYPYDSPPAIYTPHGGVLHFSRSSPVGCFLLGIELAMQSCTGAIIFESHYSKATYIEKVGGGISRDRMFVIHNGIRQFPRSVGQGRPSRPAKIKFLGEMRRIKGVETLLAAASILQNRGAEISIDLCGAGPDEYLFRNIAADIGLRNVNWRGYVRDPEAVLADADCLVVPSVSESLPYVVIEALGFGVPVVASAVGGIPEIFGDLRDLVPPKDPISLASAIQHQISNWGSLAERRLALMRRVDRLFGVVRMGDQILSVYQKCIQWERGGRERVI